MEIWKSIIGYEGLYEVSNLGRIKSLENKRPSRWGCIRTVAEFIRKDRHDKDGYKTIGLTKNGRQTHFRVHQLIARAFIPNPLNKSAINHLNGIKDDNRVENLEWCTNKENTAHMIRFGKGLRVGVKHHNAKFTPKIVREIRRMRSIGITYLEIANKYGVNPDSVRSVALGLTWKHVK